MKTFIVIISTIVVGLVIYGFIAGSNNSMKSESTRIMNETVTELQTIKP